MNDIEYSIFFQNINSPAFLLELYNSSIYKIKDVNQAFCNLFNIKKETVLSNELYLIHQFISEKAFTELQSQINRSIEIKGNTSFFIELSINNEFKKVNAKIIYGNNNNTIFIFIYIDLNLSPNINNENFFNISDTYNLVFWEWSPFSNKILFIGNSEKVIGLNDSKGYETFSTWLNRIHPEDSKLVTEELNSVIQNKKDSFSFEYRYNHPDKEYIWLYTLGKVANKNLDNKVSLIIGTTQEITKWKETELLLKESEKQLEVILQSANLGTWDWNIISGTIKVNSRFAAILGYTIEEYGSSYERFFELLHPEDRERAFIETEAFLTEKRTLGLSEYRLKHKDGTYHWISMYGSVIECSINKVPIRAVGIMQSIHESKIKEIEYHKTTRSLLLALEAGNIGIWECNLETQCNIFSDSSYQLLGTTKKDCSNIIKYFLERISEVDREFFSHIANNFLLLKRESIELEIQFKHPTSGNRWLFTKIKKLPTSNNQTKPTLIGYFHDVTNRKELLKELEQSKANLEALIESTEDGIYSIDKNYKIININSKFQKEFFTAYNIKIQAGDNILDFINNKEIKKKWKNRYDRALIGDNLYVTDTYSVFSENRYFQISINPIFLNEEIVGVTCFSRDITDILRSKKELIDSQERLEMALRAVNLGVWEYNFSSDLWNGNDTMLQILGFEPNTTFPINEIIKLIHKRDLRKLLKAYKEHSLGKVPYFKEDFRVLNSDGKYFWILTMYKIVEKNNNDSPLRIIGISMDITDDKRKQEKLTQAKEEAENANKTKTLFLANISHEIRTPLNAIIGFSELLLTGETEEVKQKDYLNSIKSSGITLLNLINDILDLSKIEAGKLELHKEPVHIKKQVNEIENIFKLKLKEKNLTFHKEYSQNLPELLLMDELRFRQILLNLVSNAVKFTDDGYIKVNLFGEHRRNNLFNLVLEVIDTGKGIPEKEHKNIFKVFEQVSYQVAKNYGGTGLGLPITNNLVQLMGGKIELESQLGKGSTFRVLLPSIEVVQIKETYNSNILFNIENIEFQPATIMIADDIISNREVLKGFLKKYKFNCIEVSSGKELVEKISSNVPDIIFMDLRMPEMDGFQTIYWLKKESIYSHIPTIAISATAFLSVQEQEMIKLFNGYLRKPVLLEKIIIELTKFLKHEVKQKPKVIDSFSPEEIKILPELLLHIEVNVIPVFESLNKKQNMAKIIEFYSLLESVYKLYPLNKLKIYSLELKKYIDSFALVSIKEHLSNFLLLVENIRNNA